MSDRPKGKSVKIGNTDGSVYTMILQQVITQPLYGNKLVIPVSCRKPEPGETPVFLNVVPLGDDVEIDPSVKAALKAMSHMAVAVGGGYAISVEKSKAEGSKETKYVITIIDD